MSGIGSSLLRKPVDPQMQQAIASYQASGGEVHRFPPNKHGECARRKGIQFRRSAE